MGKGTNYEKKPTLLDGLVLAGKLLKHTRALTAAEIAANYAVDKARFGLT